MEDWVIDVGHQSGEILESIKAATGPEFRASLERLCNPYGDGHASEVIIKHFSRVPRKASLIRKRFIDGSRLPDQTDLASTIAHAGSKPH